MAEGLLVTTHSVLGQSLPPVAPPLLQAPALKDMSGWGALASA